MDIIKTINGVQITVETEANMAKVETVLDELVEELKIWMETFRRTGRIRPKKVKKIKKECAFENFEFKNVWITVEVGDLYSEFGVGKWKALHVKVRPGEGRTPFALVKIPVVLLDMDWKEVKKMSDGEIDKIIHV